MGILDKYQYKWFIVLILFLIVARIVNQGYGLIRVSTNLYESPFVPDQLKSTLQIPFIVLITYYALILGFVTLKFKQIDSHKIYPVIILGYIVISMLFIDPLICEYVLESTLSHLSW